MFTNALVLKFLGNAPPPWALENARRRAGSLPGCRVPRATAALSAKYLECIKPDATVSASATAETSGAPAGPEVEVEVEVEVEEGENIAAAEEAGEANVTASSSSSSSSPCPWWCCCRWWWWAPCV